MWTDKSGPTFKRAKLCADSSPFARPRLGPKQKFPTMTVLASGSQETRRWSKPDSNSRSHLRRYRCEAQE